MSREFGSLLEMGLFLATRPAAIAVELHHGLDRLGATIEKTAKDEFGRYQGQAGPFEAWPELADATKDDRVAQGYPENEPLLREGDLRDSIGHEVDHAGLELAVGSTSDLMPYHEFGTSKMPARPVLGPAAFRNKDAIQRVVGAALVAGLVGADQIHEALGYDFETAD